MRVCGTSSSGKRRTHTTSLAAFGRRHAAGHVARRQVQKLQSWQLIGRIVCGWAWGVREPRRNEAEEGRRPRNKSTRPRRLWSSRKSTGIMWGQGRGLRLEWRGGCVGVCGVCLAKGALEWKGPKDQGEATLLLWEGGERRRRRTCMSSCFCLGLLLWSTHKLVRTTTVTPILSIAWPH